MRYMKKILFVLIVSFYFIALQAQTMFSPDGGMDHYEKTERTVYDTAKINVYYTLYFGAGGFFRGCPLHSPNQIS